MGGGAVEKRLDAFLGFGVPICRLLMTPPNIQDITKRFFDSIQMGVLLTKSLHGREITFLRMFRMLRPCWFIQEQRIFYYELVLLLLFGVCIILDS